jgi:predicted nuclease of predicted toxin-antitoxin system
VKLLIDQNISRRVLPALAEEFSGSLHVVHLGMDHDDDIRIWDYAKDNGFVIVTKDKDFLQRSVLLGHPPKIIHITIGNCPVSDIVNLLLNNVSHLKIFHKHASKSYVLLP